MKGQTNRFVRNAAISAAAVLLASSVSSAQTVAHRYSFTGGSLADTGTVGGLTLGNAGGVTFSSDRAFLPGGASNANGFLSVASGILPTTDLSASVETWGAYDSTTGDWSRIFDFGGGATGTADYLFLTPKGGGAITRAALKRNNTAEQVTGVAGTPLVSVGAVTTHYSNVVFNTTADTLSLYTDGFLLSTVGGATYTLAGLPSAQNYIGKAVYPDPQLKGSIDEFRTTFSALTAADVLASYGAGPNALVNFNTPLTLSVANGDIATGSSFAGVGATALDRVIVDNGGVVTSSGSNAAAQVRLTNGTLRVNGGTLDLAGGIDFTSAAGQTSAVEVTGGGTLNLSAMLDSSTAGTRTLSLNGGTINFNLPRNVTASSAATTLGAGTNTIGVNSTLDVVSIGTLTGIVSGAGGFTKTGTGVLQLSGVNTFAGNVDVTAGQILIGNAAGLGSTAGNTTIRANASIRNNGFKVIAENFDLNGGQFQAGGATRTTLTGTISLSADYNAAFPTFAVDGGSSFYINGNINAVGGDRTIVLGGNSTTASVINGQLNLGAGGTLSREGGGVWALANNSNTFSFANVTGTSVLRIGSGDAPTGQLAGPVTTGGITGQLPTDAFISLADATSVVEFGRADNIAVSNLLSGAGIVRKLNVGTLTLNNTDNDFSGGIQIDGGTLIVPNLATIGLAGRALNLINAQGAVAVPAAVTAANGITASGILDKFSTSSTGALALSANSSEAINFQSSNFIGLHLGAVIGGTYTYSGAISPNADVFRFGGGGGDLIVASNLLTGANEANKGNSLEVAGQGTVRLAGANTYTGTTSVLAGGTLRFDGVGDVGASSAIIVNGGTASFTTTPGGNTDLTTKPLTLTNAQVDTNGNTITFNNSLVNSTVGYITKVGTGTLVFNNATGGTLAAPVLTANPDNVFVRRGELVLQNKTQITTKGYSSVGQGVGDTGTLSVKGNSILFVTGDFNVADNPSVATLNLADSAIIQANTFYLGKIGFLDGVNAGQQAVGTANQTGGTLQSNPAAGGDWRIGGGNGVGDINAVGTYNLSGGTLTTVRNFQVGAYGKGTLNQTGGTVNQTGGFFAVGRFSSSVGIYNISGGTWTYSGAGNNQMIIAEDGNGTLNVSGSASVSTKFLSLGLGAVGTGTVNQSGGGVAIVNLTGTGLGGGAGTSTYNLSGGVLNMNGTDVAATLDTFTFTGGELRNVNAFNKPLTQTGATSLLTAGGTNATTTIVGNYSLSTGTATVTSGHTISVGGAFTLADNATVNGTGTLVATGANAAYNLKRGTISAGLGGAGAVNVNKTTIGTVTLVGNAAFDPISTGAGVTDLVDGKLVLDYTGGLDPVTSIPALLDTAYDSAFSTGRIKSSSATALRGIGFTDNTTTSKFTLAATYYGDSDLDLDVDFDDLLSLARNYGVASGKTWATGDFNYDQGVTFDDLLALARNYGKSITSPVAAASSATFEADWALAQSLAAVPEPTTLGLLAGGLTLLGRRRKA